jgi:hypothetical protein
VMLVQGKRKRREMAMRTAPKNQLQKKALQISKCKTVPTTKATQTLSSQPQTQDHHNLKPNVPPSQPATATTHYKRRPPLPPAPTPTTATCPTRPPARAPATAAPLAPPTTRTTTTNHATSSPSRPHPPPTSPPPTPSQGHPSSASTSASAGPRPNRNYTSKRSPTTAPACAGTRYKWKPPPRGNLRCNSTMGCMP